LRKYELFVMIDAFETLKFYAYSGPRSARRRIRRWCGGGATVSWGRTPRGGRGYRNPADSSQGHPLTDRTQYTVSVRTRDDDEDAGTPGGGGGGGAKKTSHTHATTDKAPKKHGKKKGANNVMTSWETVAFRLMGYPHNLTTMTFQTTVMPDYFNL